MLELEEKGAHNINLVTPTHYAPEIKSALIKAGERGMKIPVVYNSSGYERVETLKSLEGIIDIYMPDAKFASRECSEKYSDVSDYAEVNKKALIEMKRQAGDLKIKNDIAVSGMLIRHMVLPGEEENSKKALEWIMEELGDVHLSIMSQYHPCHEAALRHPVIGRRLNAEEYGEIVQYADELGFTKVFTQEL